MQELTRFPELENVILIEENYTPEYKEIQSWLKNYFSHGKFIGDRALHDTITFDCIYFEDITHKDKDRFEYQISQVFPIIRGKDIKKACVLAFDKYYIIKKINDNSFDCYNVVPDYPSSEGEAKLCDVGTFSLKYTEYEIVYCIIKKLAKNRLFEDKEEFDIVYNFCKTFFNGSEKDFLKCLLYPDELDGYAPYPHNYSSLENYSDLKTRLFERKNNLIKASSPPATEQPTKTKEFDNTTLTQIHNGDSYKELINDSLVIELVDSEVNWIDYHKEINEFLYLKPLWEIYQFTIDTTNRKRLQIFDKAFWLNLFHHEAKWNWIKNHVTENEYWKDKKILIKDVSSKYDTIGEYGAYLNNLSFDIKYNRRGLNITDNDLQDLKKRREELYHTTKLLDSLIWNDWGRDHEQKGGEYITHTEKEEVSMMYHSKFYLSKLWGILSQYCVVKNVGGNYSNHSAKYFTTSNGENVYITGGFLNLLYNIFGLRLSTFDKIIQHLEPFPTTTTATGDTPATEQPANKKPIKEKPVISFKAMFKDPLQYEKVLEYVGEYLTDTNQWKGSIKLLSAFYGVLRDRGYLNKCYNAPQINNTFKNEFSIEATTTDKNFQVTPINKAVGVFEEDFNMIPPFKPTK